MNHSTPIPLPLAKLGRPRLHEVLPRERLFRSLDDRLRRSALWVCGPPGAGKTTLMASFLDARTRNGLWFQCDAGDRDLSTWFYYLGEATAQHAPGSKPLPLLTPEYLPDLAGFGRRWFRQCFSQLGPGVLVLDNYQEACTPALDTLLSAALADVPHGLSIVFVSRAEPSPAYSRALTHGEMSVLGWDALRLSLEEATALAAAKGISAGSTVQSLLSTCEGWAAGLTLLLEQSPPDAPTEAHTASSSLDTLFAYFAGQVFDALLPASQRDLVLCSYPPRVSRAHAAELTGNPATGDLLEQLHRRQMFTHRRSAPGAVYEFHALFRAFLRSRALHLLTAAEHTRALRNAAATLLALEQRTEALALYAEAGDWDTVAGIIAEHAGSLLAQGRGRTLSEWLSSLPLDVIARDPWMRYWQGAALIPHDQQRARAVLTRAHEDFTQADDFAGQVAAASGVLDTYFFSYSGYAELARWAECVAQLLSQTARFNSPAQRLQACSTYLLACFFGDGRHPALAFYVAEIQRLIRTPLDPLLRLRAGTYLVSYAGAVLHPALVEADLELLEGLAADPAVAPLRQAQWHQRFAYLRYLLGEFDIAETRLILARQLCDEHGLRAPVSLINQILVFVLTARGDAERAAQILKDWERLLSSDRPVERSQWNIARLVVWCAQQNSSDDWVRIAHEVAAQMDTTGQTWIRLANRLPGLYALIERGEFDCAAQWLEELRAIMTGTCFERFERDVLLGEAALALYRGDHRKVTAPLGEALHMTLSEHVPLHLAQNRRVLARLLEHASADDALREPALTIAARYGVSASFPVLPPPSVLTVRTLGGFELLRPNSSGAAPGAIQRRPLVLLKYLVAQGGRAVPLSAAQEALWPEAEGDRAASALKVAVHRLRQILRTEAAIVVGGGSIVLDPLLCRSDVHAFEQGAGWAEQRRAAGDLAAFEAVARDTLALYRGPFLPEVEEAPWILAARERLAQRARQLTLTLGTHYETLNRVDEAIAAYEACLAMDALSEKVYQMLMQLHLRDGRHADAIRVFRRCRDMFSTVLGLAPGAHTQSLFRQAQAGTPDHSTP